MTPEELREKRLQKRRLTRMRFRAAVRKVIVNRHWLSELEDITLGDNVKRNVAILVRKKVAKGILSIHEKVLLSTPVEYRTGEQKRKAVNLVAGLACFSFFRPKIRSRMSKVIYFQFFERGRTILREGHYPNAMYFILDGSITATVRKWKWYDNSWVDEPVAVLGPGDMFGEVALLRNIRRTATCTTSANTELLCIYKSDFDLVLRDTLQLQWEQINTSLMRFEYFKNWTRTQIRECCMLGSIKQFEPLQTIYGEDKGRLSQVFFVLSGNCVILQGLKMKSITSKSGNFKYELSDMERVESASRELIEKFHQAAELKRSKSTSRTVAFDEQKTETASIDEVEIVHPIDLKRTSIPKSDLKHVRKDVMEFVEVGSFNCGAVFGLGEQMEHRTIVAKNYVQCLLIPRYWLFQKSQNMGNVWQRTKMHLDSSIPSRQKIFNDFLSTNNWKKYKASVIKDYTRLHPVVNATTLLDVPIICRIEDGL